MTRRAVALAALVPVGAVPAVAVGNGHSDGHKRVVIGGHQVRFDGLGPEKWAARWRREHRMVLRLRRRLQAARPVVAPAGPEAAIRYVFGPYAEQALRVAGCESGLSIYAHNGQYHGLFQMGEHERAVYGDAPDAVGQSQAAYRYFVASGRDWSPWSCRWAAKP